MSYCSLTGAAVDFKQEFTSIGRVSFLPPHLVQPVHLAAASGQVGIVENLLNNGELACQCHHCAQTLLQLYILEYTSLLQQGTWISILYYTV